MKNEKIIILFLQKNVVIFFQPVFCIHRRSDIKLDNQASQDNIIAEFDLHIVPVGNVCPGRFILRPIKSISNISVELATLRQPVMERKQIVSER